MEALHRRRRWLDAIVVRAVASSEAAAGVRRPDDEDAVQAAARATPEFERRVVLRAWMLAQRSGLGAEIERWRALLPWILVIAALLVGLLSVPMLRSVIGEARHISLLAALAAVLTLPTLSLLLWCGSLLMGPRHVGGGLPRGIVALLARTPGLRSRHSVPLWSAAIETLREAGLGLWALGVLNHAFWILAFVGILIGLLASFAFWSYTIGWETTILSQRVFLMAIQAIGWLPSQLGFPSIDPGLANQAAAGQDQAPRAWWLIGCLLVYGLLPRLLALGVCVGVAWRRWPALGRIDTQAPAWAALAQRFAGIDASLGATTGKPIDRPRAALAVVGLELPPAEEWPALDASVERTWEQLVEGGSKDRQAAIEQAAETRPAALLVICRAAATPDRGTERFVQALTAGSDRAAIWLRGGGEHAAWRPWLAASDLRTLAVLRDAAQAQAWIGEVRRG